jgi:DNA ligase-1
MITRPMLAADLVETIKDPITGSKRDILHLEWIRYPVLATPKIDGIRCVCQNGDVLSREFKPIPNKFIREVLTDLTLDFPDSLTYDGELVTLNPDGSYKKFNPIQSDVMSRDGNPDFRYLVFDFIEDNKYLGYQDRVHNLNNLELRHCPDIYNALASSTRVIRLQPTLLHNLEDLLSYEEKCLELGYEGICFRDPNSPYKDWTKSGRSTVKEGFLIKLKRYETGKAEVLDYYELLHNSNQAETDNFGLTKRSSCAVGMVGGSCLGGLNARDLVSGITFDVGSGFSQRERKELYKLGGGLKGKHFLYKFFPQGIKEAPRHPIFMEWLS